jgi:hypothetical protein
VHTSYFDMRTEFPGNCDGEDEHASGLCARVFARKIREVWHWKRTLEPIASAYLHLGYVGLRRIVPLVAQQHFETQLIPCSNNLLDTVGTLSELAHRRHRRPREDFNQRRTQIVGATHRWCRAVDPSPQPSQR